jgi:hypothetical protein
MEWNGINSIQSLLGTTVERLRFRYVGTHLRYVGTYLFYGCDRSQSHAMRMHFHTHTYLYLPLIIAYHTSYTHILHTHLLSIISTIIYTLSMTDATVSSIINSNIATNIAALTLLQQPTNPCTALMIIPPSRQYKTTERLNVYHLTDDECRLRFRFTIHE